MNHQNQTAALDRGPVPILLEGRGREKKSEAERRASRVKRRDCCAKRRKRRSKLLCLVSYTSGNFSEVFNLMNL